MKPPFCRRTVPSRIVLLIASGLILGTRLAFADGSVGDPFKWKQLPDLRMGYGVDVNATCYPQQGSNTWRLLADDFLCTSTGPITNIHVWGSWLQNVYPQGNASNVLFTLSLHKDVPGGTGHPFSMPGERLWSQPFGPGQFTARVVSTEEEGWYTPGGMYMAAGDSVCWEYNFPISAQEAYSQTGTVANPVIYWLDVQAQPMDPTTQALFGWKTSVTNWHDTAVWVAATEQYAGLWNSLAYPSGHNLAGHAMDFAFVIDGGQEAGLSLDWGDAPAPYPTTAAANGANHVISPQLWLGGATDKPDAEADGQPDPAALGDDKAGASPDDENGVRIPPLVVGVPMNVTFTVSGAAGGGWVSGWIDFSGNGVWGDAPGEQIVGAMYPDGTWTVPVVAPAGSASNTFARFRVSTAAGALPTGPMPDGEVEDYAVSISADTYGAKMHYPQLPDPNGWDVDGSGQFVLGDDFLCTSNGLITDIYFWGSWLGDAVNPIGNVHLSIHDNVPGGAYSMPGNLLWQWNTAEVSVEPAGQSWQGWIEPSSGSFMLNNHTNYFLYHVHVPERFAFEQAAGNIYWLDVNVAPAGGGSWGWKTSASAHFMDDAVWRYAEGGPASWLPMEDPITGESLDLAFYIEGVPLPEPSECYKWQQPFDKEEGLDLPTRVTEDEAQAKMHYPQVPDPVGWDVRATSPLMLADDFLCTYGGPVTHITFWGSWAANIVGQIQNAHLSLHSNIAQGPSGWSVPGPQLWAMETGPLAGTPMAPSLQGWEDPQVNAWMPGDHVIWFQYDVDIPAADAFVQEAGTVYWLDIQVQAANGTWGWKTTAAPHFMDLPVWMDSVNGPPIWQEVYGYQGEAVDLAFVVYTPVPVPKAFRLADDWLCDGRPVTAIRWWGSYLGRESVTPPDGTEGRPTSFLIGWWTDQPATNGQFSQPAFERTNVTAVLDAYGACSGLPGHVCETYAWTVTNKLTAPGYEHEYEYYTQLETPWLEKEGNVYWLTVEPVYDSTTNAVWGWATTERRDLLDDAVVWKGAGSGAAAWQKLAWPAADWPYLFDTSNGGYDPFTTASGEEYGSLNLAFELLTDVCPRRAKKWSEPPDMFAGMNMTSWRHRDDQQGYGYQLRADDFVSDGRRIADIHWWGSYLGWEYTRPGGPTNPVAPPQGTSGPLGFDLSWHADGGGMPGETLTNVFVPAKLCHEVFYGTVTQTWNGAGIYEHEYQYYTDLLDPRLRQEPWREVSNTTYWLNIQAVFTNTFQPAGGQHSGWGWKISNLQKLSPSVVSNRFDRGWSSERLPVLPDYARSGQPFDLAFELTTDVPGPSPWGTPIVFTNVFRYPSTTNDLRLDSLGTSGAGTQYLQLSTNLIAPNWTNIDSRPWVFPWPIPNGWYRLPAQYTTEFYRILEK